jgi:AraC family transcriptional regulator of adaptative response / DNA-3-methyladenine glycosylase II
VRLAYREPYDWAQVIGFFTARAIPGVEVVADGVYARSWRDGSVSGYLRIAAADGALEVEVTPVVPDAVLARIRFVFDLDRDPAALARHFAGDALLAAAMVRRPGLRVPGGWDGFELAVRAVLGQQVSVVAARNLAGRLVELCGIRHPDPRPGLGYLFPTPAELLATDLGGLGMPGSRRATLRAVATAACADPELFIPSALSVARLMAIPGIGDWTAQYIALRALRDADAFPSSDIGLLRAAATGGVRPTAAALLARAEAWRPHRAYAAQHLWAADPLDPSGVR